MSFRRSGSKDAEGMYDTNGRHTVIRARGLISISVSDEGGRGEKALGQKLHVGFFF